MNNKKLVNIYPSMPITDFNPPIRVATKRVYKTFGDIRTCLMRRAIVDEILPDGTTVRLGLHNYNKVLVPVIEKAEEKEVETEVSVAVETSSTEEEVVAETEVETNPDANKAVWQAAYDEALANVDFSSMSNKQRKAAKAAARAAADEAVANLSVVEEETVETTEEVVTEDTAVVEDVEAPAEEIVETVDAEDLTDIVE